MATVTDRQKKAMGIFQFVLELVLALFKAHHKDPLGPPAQGEKEKPASEQVR